MAEETVVIQKVVVGQMYRRTEDIGTWLEAVKSAESIHFPVYKRLLEVYNRIVVDGAVTSAMRKRIQEVTNTELMYLNREGEHDEQMEDLIDSPWFLRMLELLLETRFYGHSVLEPAMSEGEIHDMELIPRHHINRIKGLILLEEYNETGAIQFREGVYRRHLLEVGRKNDLGLLMKVAPYVLYKQGGMGDWAHFAELFGMPMRIYHYNPLDPTSRLEVEKQAQEQGSAAYIIVPNEVTVDFAEAANATGSSDMYDGLRKAMNEEIAITILGNNLTTSNSKTGTYALGEVHQDEQSRIHADDLRYVEGILNHTAQEFLQYWGLPLKKGYSFRFDRSEKLSLSQRIDLDTKVNAVAPIDPAYFYDKYGVPESTEREETPPEPPEPDKEDQEDKGKKPEGQAPAASLTHDHCCGAEELEVPSAITQRFRRIWDKMLRRIYNGLIPAGTTDMDMVRETGDQLFGNAFREGFGKWDLEDADFLTPIHTNLFTFSGAKNLAELKALRSLVFQDGKKIPYTQFREAAREIYQDYRETWLRAEYNQVVRAGTMAQQWRDLEKTKHLYPYLRYVTEQDSRVRPEHAAMEGIVRPVDDYFWQTYFPPNGWNCRCSVRKVAQSEIDKGTYILTPETDANDLGRENVQDQYWLGNIAKTGMVFRDKGHRYFAGLSGSELRHIQRVASYWRNANPLTREAGYIKQNRVRGRDGGYLDVHTDAHQADLQANVAVGQSMANRGYKVRIRPHLEHPTGDNSRNAFSNAELEIWQEDRWRIADIKEISGSRASIQNAIKDANRQGCEIVVMVMDSWDQAIMKRALSGAWQAGRNKSVKEAWVISGETLNKMKRR